MDKKLAADLIPRLWRGREYNLLAVLIHLSIYSEHDRACNAGFV